MLTDKQKLQKISEICNHPGAFHWQGRDMARVITSVINDDKPIPYLLSEADEPIHYELTHDAVYGANE